MTPHAQRAHDRLQESSIVHWMVRNDINRNDEAVKTSGPHPNAPFNEALEYHFGVAQVCHAADTLNSYLQPILAEILEFDSSLFSTDWKIGYDVEQAIARLKKHRAQDGRVRAAVHHDLNAFWSPETDIVCLLRNRFVHQSGYDKGKKVRAAIDAQGDTWCPIPPVDLPPVVPVHYRDGDWLDADATLGNWACRHVMNHIHLMDQNLSAHYELSGKKWRPRPFSRSIAPSMGAPSLPITPGQPLQREDAPAKQPQDSVKALDLPSPEAMEVSPEEKHCAKVWMKLQKDISEFITGYIKESGVHVDSGSAGRVGTLLGHTLRGHNIQLTFGIVPESPQAIEGKREVGVRIRQRDFRPFVTVWGTKSEMCDFEVEDLTAELKDYLESCLREASNG